MKISLKNASLPMVAVALASSQALADHPEGAHIDATGQAQARWYLSDSTTTATPYLRTEELNVNLAINAAKDHTFAGIEFESIMNNHARPSAEYSTNDKFFMGFRRYFVGVDFGFVKATAGNEQNTGFYQFKELAGAVYTVSGITNNLYWFDDGIEAVRAPGLTFEAPVAGWTLGLNLGAIGDQGTSNVYNVTASGEVAGTKLRVGYVSGSEQETIDATTKTVGLSDVAGYRVAADSKIADVNLGLEYVSSTSNSYQGAADGTKVGAYKKATGATDSKATNSWASVHADSSLAMGENALVYAIDYKMATENQTTAKQKYDVNGFGLNVGYKMANFHKGASLTSGVALKNATQKDNVSANTTFEDNSVSRFEVYTKYKLEGFSTGLTLRNDTAKGKLYKKSSDGSATNKATKLYASVGYNF